MATGNGTGSTGGSSDTSTSDSESLGVSPTVDGDDDTSTGNTANGSGPSPGMLVGSTIGAISEVQPGSDTSSNTEDQTPSADDSTNGTTDTNGIGNILGLADATPGSTLSTGQTGSPLPSGTESPNSTVNGNALTSSGLTALGTAGGNVPSTNPISPQLAIEPNTSTTGNASPGITSNSNEGDGNADIDPTVAPSASLNAPGTQFSPAAILGAVPSPSVQGPNLLVSPESDNNVNSAATVQPLSGQPASPLNIAIPDAITGIVNSVATAGGNGVSAGSSSVESSEPSIPTTGPPVGGVPAISILPSIPIGVPSSVPTEGLPNASVPVGGSPVSTTSSESGSTSSTVSVGPVASAGLQEGVNSNGPAVVGSCGRFV